MQTLFNRFTESDERLKKSIVSNTSIDYNLAITQRDEMISEVVTTCGRYIRYVNELLDKE